MPDLKPPRLYPTERQAKAAVIGLGLLLLALLAWVAIYGPGLRAVHSAVGE